VRSLVRSERSCSEKIRINRQDAKDARRERRFLASVGVLAVGF
jgi:hypothetical protein